MTENRLLLKTRKNVIFGLIQKVDGLSVSDFYWKEEEFSFQYFDSLCSVLHYKKCNYYYAFLHDYSHSMSCEYSPGSGNSVEKHEINNWRMQYESATRWLCYIKREIEAPDLWQEIEKYQEVLPLESSEQLVNEPIPAYEADIMNDRLMLLAEQIEKKFELQGEESKFVRQKISYLADAARRQPRRDWEHTAVGVLMSLSFGLALAPEQAKSLFELAKNALKGMFYLMGS